MKIIELKNTKIPLYISDNLRNQIQYLCTKIADVEWSGILFHDLEGNIDDLKTMKLYAQELLPMNKGTKGYTEYDYDEEYTKFLKSKVNGNMKELVKLLKDKNKNRISHIHSHNNMNVFFSGTDTQELIDGSSNPDKPYYLSLIVNNKGDMCAKISYRGIIETEGHEYSKITYKDINGKVIIENNNKELNNTEEVMFVVDCDIILFYDIDDNFVNRTEKIIEEAEKRKKHIQLTNQNNKSYNSNRTGIISNYNSNSQLNLFENDNNIDNISTSNKEYLNLFNINDNDIKNFISKVISFNIEDNLGIETNLNDIQFNIDNNQIDLDLFADKLEEQIFLTYEKCFGILGEGHELLEIICERASDIIDTYESQFPFVNIISHELWNISQLQSEPLFEEELILNTN